MQITLNTNSIDDYRKFIAVKKLPRYSLTGSVATFDDCYASLVDGCKSKRAKPLHYMPSIFLFDYQAAVARMAIKKQRYAVFADCGLGKTLVAAEYAMHALRELPQDQKLLIVAPLMVVKQTIDEYAKFYTTVPEQVKSANLQDWLNGSGGRFGITNYDAINDDLTAGQLGGLILDESSMLKSMYGKWGTKLIDLGKGLTWKLCLTGTPAPNDRIEYGNHAVFLDQFPTLNAFLARYFINKGQTDARWELKKHALEPFYRSMSDWSIFLSNPAVYGWKDNARDLPPINIHIEDVELTAEQRTLTASVTGELIPTSFGGIVSRGALARIAKGTNKGESVDTLKYKAIDAIVKREPDRSTIIWCHYNDEQDRIAEMYPDAANIDGSTPELKRLELIDDFNAGRRKLLISKSKILGFGLNLQVCTRMIFSTLQDSYESYYQCVKRANRYGSTEPLDVYIPVTELEMPMVQTVLDKAHRVNQDTQEQERIFRQSTQGILA